MPHGSPQINFDTRIDRAFLVSHHIYPYLALVGIRQFIFYKLSLSL